MSFTGHPGLFFLVFWPITGAFISYILGKKNKTARDYFANFVTALTLVVMLLMTLAASNEHPPVFMWNGFMGFKIFFKLDGLRCVYGVITAFMWMMTTLFSKEYFAHYHNRNRYYFFMLLTFGATMGVFFSADLITTFIFFEIMSMTSYVMVIHDERPAALEASKTYMTVAVIGGLAMLFGIFIISHELHTTEIGKLYDAMHHFHGNKAMIYLAAFFILIGFGGKAGMYPLHIWLPNAHPVAPAPASALLSGVLTKTGIYGIIIMGALVFAHEFEWGLVMLNIGVLGMFTGAFLALLSTDLKRTLACSSVSQIGFIVVGIGMQGILGHHNALAVRGTLLHMVNHSLIKLVLFMMAGVIYMNIHELDLNKVRGFGRGKPLFTFCFLMGVLGIIGLPFWNGYISKTLLHESIVEQIWLYPDYTNWSTYFQVVESIFTLTGGLTTAYMIKIFTCVCIEKNQFNQAKLSALNGRYMNTTSAAVLFISALILPILGVIPEAFMVPISKFGQEFMMGEDPAHAVHFYWWINLKGAVASLTIGALLYALVVRVSLMLKDAEGRSIYVNVWPKFIDLEKKVYRPMLFTVLPFIGALFARTVGSLLEFIAKLGYRVFMRFRAYWVESAAKPSGDNALTEARDNVARQQERAFDIAPVRRILEAYGQKSFVLGGVQSRYENVLSKLLGAIAFVNVRGYYEKALSGLNNTAGATWEGNVGSGIAEESPYQWGLYNRAVHWIRTQYNRLLYFFRIRDERYGVPSAAPVGEKNELVRTVLNSLAYSLLLFLVGACIVLIFVFLA